MKEWSANLGVLALAGALACLAGPARADAGAWSGAVAAGRVMDLRGRPLPAQDLELLLEEERDRGYPAALRVSHADITGQLDLQDMEVSLPVSFDGCRFRGPVHLEYAVFDRGLAFRGCSFTAQVWASQARVSGPLQVRGDAFALPADFDSMRVSEGTLLDGDTFAQGVNLSDFSDDGDLDADGSRFGGDATATGMDIQGNLFLDHCAFLGRAVFLQSSVLKNCQMEGASFASDADFASLKVGGSLHLDQTRFQGPVDLSYSDVQRVFIDPVKTLWPAGRDVDFDGLKFQEFIARKDGDNATNQPAYPGDIPILKKIKYNTEFYRNLEAYFSSIGDSDQADAIYILSRRRQDRAGGLWNWIAGFCLDVSCGYGRHDERFGYLFLLVFAWGCLAFRKERMRVSEDEVYRRGGEGGAESVEVFYHPALYTLDLLLVGLELGMAERWEPQPEQVSGFAFYVVCRVVSLIFFSAFLAAVGGFLK